MSDTLEFYVWSSSRIKLVLLLLNIDLFDLFVIMNQNVTANHADDTILDVSGKN